MIVFEQEIGYVRIEVSDNPPRAYISIDDREMQLSQREMSDFAVAAELAAQAIDSLTFTD